LDVVAAGRQAHVHRHAAGESFPLAECCPFETPTNGEGLPPEVWERALEVHSHLAARRVGSKEPPTEVRTLAEQRQGARAAKDWALADDLRDQIATLGWQVKDTPEGPELKPK
jgi:hypothetical protein